MSMRSFLFAAAAATSGTARSSASAITLGFDAYRTITQPVKK